MMTAIGLVAVLAVALGEGTLAFPMYGGKRLSRSWPLPLAFYPTRDSRPSAPYYEPYGDLVDLYYPQDPYDKYRLYQIQMPYYYPEMYSYHYGYEDMGAPDNMDESDWMEGEGNEEESDAQANAYFLHNLILAQVYKDAATKGLRYPLPYAYPKPTLEDYDDGYVYGEPVKEAVPSMDQDVLELKSLIDDKPKTHHRLERTKNSQKGSGLKINSFPDNQWIPSTWKRSQKTTAAVTTPLPASTTAKPFERGQQEVVMPRPATPLKTPYHTRSHEPSVYDAIKKLLHMQEELDRSKGQPKKRSLIPSEDSLVEQLDSLRKSP